MDGQSSVVSNGRVVGSFSFECVGRVDGTSSGLSDGRMGEGMDQ